MRNLTIPVAGTEKIVSHSGEHIYLDVKRVNLQYVSGSYLLGEKADYIDH